MFLLSAGLFSAVAQGADRLGQLEVSDLLLEPTIFYGEPKVGQFQPGNSILGVSWIRDSVISGKIAVGTKALLGAPARYGSVNDQELGIVEGYAQADSYLGRVRLGLVPLAFGLEGGAVEARLRFPRSLLFQKRLFPLRDYGLSYAIDWNGYFSEWQLHNGEAGRDLDNQTWFTATWGYRPSAKFRVGASAQVGRTTILSTNPTGALSSSSAGLDVNQPSKIRAGNAFVDFTVGQVSVAVEATAGEIAQDPGPSGGNSSFGGGHADAYWTFSEAFAGLARWDQYVAKSDARGTDWAQAATVGIAYRQPYETSVVYLYATKTWQKSAAQDDHSVRLVWRITPYASARR